ncbi:hypothetical protein Dvina_16715 [Dactylosporangium vinaceum]|uniref:hypothetical protein n=1 Tax=Dactylosporangium vinaceum TaxID=53362 RepID=UPI001CA8FCAA|nr:hypothetical protein [Dactylosporangium vinaceum]UAB99564.1 hypothetical protein Dvina_16715 [Dactylosporangium vinaceum]
MTDRSAGFGDPLPNLAVEDAAMDAAVHAYKDEGWRVEAVSREKLAWNLSCPHPGGRTAQAKSRASAGAGPTVLLTANEVRAATSERDWVLLVVPCAPTQRAGIFRSTGW